MGLRVQLPSAPLQLIFKEYKMKESVFFGNEGLTSTSANYYANVAQEMIQAATERLNSVKFYQVSVASIGGGEKQLMTVGQTSLDFIKDDLEKSAEMNSFCAWVREAIKKKEEMISYLAATSIEKWAKENGIEIPEQPEYPESLRRAEEKEVIDSWDGNKRNKYLRLEAFASTYGKYIHPKGAFSKARKDVHAAENCPIYKEGSGRDLILYYQDPTIEVEKVDNMFMSLQDTYRSYEKELNALKAELKEEVNKLSNTQEQEYREKMAEFKAKYDKYTSELGELRSRFNSWKTSEMERISKLKIALPKNLLDIFEEIRRQGDSSSK